MGILLTHGENYSNSMRLAILGILATILATLEAQNAALDILAVTWSQL